MLNHIYGVVLSKSLSMSPIFVWCALPIMGSFGPMSRISVPTQLFGIYKMPDNALQPTAQRRLSFLCGFCSSARPFALGLPSDNSSRSCPCRRLVVILAQKMGITGLLQGPFTPSVHAHVGRTPSVPAHPRHEAVRCFQVSWCGAGR